MGRNHAKKAWIGSVLFAIGYVELCCISSAGLNALSNGLFGDVTLDFWVILKVKHTGIAFGDNLEVYPSPLAY